MDLTDIEQQIIEATFARRPDLEPCVDDVLRLHETLVTSYDHGGKLLTCGNGGSQADAMHIVGELCKSFERKRPLDKELLTRLEGLPHGDELIKNLEAGLPAVTLGLNSSLKTAVENDSPLRDMAFAQEANAVIRPRDVLLAISTSGNAQNCLMAMAVAKAREGVAVSLTGPHGGAMARFADIAIKAPGDDTKTVQEAHIVLYHAICGLIEAHYFPEPR